MTRSRPRLHSSLHDMAIVDELIAVPLLPDVERRFSERSDLPAAGRLRLGDVDLGVGRPVVARGFDAQGVPPPALWLADSRHPHAAASWRRLVDLFPGTGLWPLLLTPLSADSPHRPWNSGELGPTPVEDVDALSPETVLATGWADSLVPIGTNPYVEHLRPYGAEFPGLSAPLQRAAPPASVPSDVIERGRWARIGLVSCQRPADAVAVIGWYGAINSRSSAQISAVLRSWEERLGVVLAGLGFATLTLLVPRPPSSESEALPIAAELAALCPDVLSEDGPVDGFGYEAGGTVAGLAKILVDRTMWKLWWD